MRRSEGVGGGCGGCGGCGGWWRLGRLGRLSHRRCNGELRAGEARPHHLLPLRNRVPAVPMEHRAVVRDDPLEHGPEIQGRPVPDEPLHSPGTGFPYSSTTITVIEPPPCAPHRSATTRGSIAARSTRAGCVTSTTLPPASTGARSARPTVSGYVPTTVPAITRKVASPRAFVMARASRVSPPGIPPLPQCQHRSRPRRPPRKEPHGDRDLGTRLRRHIGGGDDPQRRARRGHRAGRRARAPAATAANRVTYRSYSGLATSNPSEQNTAATSAVRQSMRRLGMSLKIMKNSTTPRANAVVSRPKRHSQSRAKLRVTLLALRASQAVSTLLSTSSAPVPSTMERSSSLAMGQGRRSSVSNTSFKAARKPPNRRVENHRNKGSATAGDPPPGSHTPATAASTRADAAAGARRPGAGGGAGPLPPPSPGPRVWPGPPGRSFFRPGGPPPGGPGLVRAAAPASGANRKPSAAPITTPNMNGPNPVLCSLTRPPPGRRGPPPRRGAAARATGAAAARIDR